jgi:hypothetical protein
MTEDEERVLARGVGREFGIPGPDDHPLISDAGPAFFRSAALICGIRPAECSLMQSERLHLFFLLYEVRRFGAAGETPSLERAMAVAIESLLLRGADMAKSTLLVGEAALNQGADLVALVGEAGRWPELARWEDGSE